MTPTSTETPLRRSEVGTFRENPSNVTINDDEEERRQARRRTILQTASGSETTTFEDNETLKKCLEIYNGNKLSRENAWSLSLIDTLSTLLDRHHKSLNNFKVAGSSLEASSKVYSLRVDSIHIDVLRMSAGLNAQKFSEKNIVDDDDDDVATGGEGGADPNSSAAGVTDNASEKEPPPKVKPKRARRVVSTVTKNKETLNARLDTVPLQDPVFGKLNATVGSINSSNRLMNNILLTTDSELRLRTTFRFWDAGQLPECDYTAEISLDNEEEQQELAPCDRLFSIQNFEASQLRPLHGGYIISDTPEVIADEKENTRRFSMTMDGGAGGDFAGGGAGDIFHNSRELTMAFDMNAECEPMPVLSEQMPVVEVDFADFDDLTTEERTAINNCRGLRKAPVLIEDLRPVDASSKLEYSYRPLDKISRFWAGPSHWKFKRSRTRFSTLSQQGENSVGRRTSQQRVRRANNLSKKRSKQLHFEAMHDDEFLSIQDKKVKLRKVNVQKKWDQRKIKLPNDLQLEVHVFDKDKFAPGTPWRSPHDATADDNLHNVAAHNSSQDLGASTADTSSLPAEHPFDQHFADDSRGGMLMNVSTCGTMSGPSNVSELNAGGDNATNPNYDSENGADTTVLEIANEFEGAPSQVTKIIVPFAKRAKVIDMKSLKRCCNQLLQKQLKRHIAECEMPQHPVPKSEKYADGLASFKEIYTHLPELLTPSMTEVLSPSVAYYSMLHLANDFNLRLLPQTDLEDFKIRQVLE